MNDQLKKYVQDNRNGFDHLDPSPAVFDRIKDGMKPKPKPANKVFSSLTVQKWMAAAAVLITISITYLLFKETVKKQPSNQEVVRTRPAPVPDKKPVDDQQTAHVMAMAQPKKDKLKNRQALPKHNTRQLALQLDMATIYNELSDSSSASTRLAAVLKIQRSAMINNDMIDRLAKTMNHDNNSNVRLAVLDVLGSYASDAHVSTVLVQSLANHEDPLVQLGLISLLAKTNNKNLDAKLYALANDPNTFAEVKDQAYLALLNQNKL